MSLKKVYFNCKSNIKRRNRVKGVLPPDKPQIEINRETQPYCGWRSQQERKNKNAQKRYKKKKDEEDRVYEKKKKKRPKLYQGRTNTRIP